MTTPVWVERLSPKEGGQINPEGNGNRTRQEIGGRDPVQNSRVDPHLQVIESQVIPYCGLSGEPPLTLVSRR